MTISLDALKTTLTSASGLSLDVTARPDSPLMEEFFEGYDASFVLPDEKEDLDGFRRCLELMQPPARERLLKRYGPHVEVIAVAREQAGGPAIGGANFIAYPHGAFVTGNLHYLFLRPGQRGRGLFRKIAAAAQELMADLFAPPQRRTLAFIELNDPFVLSDADYELDSRIAGVDQFDRLAIWSRIDARIVDFLYVQPPLSDHQEAERGLIYAVLGAGGDTSIDPALMLKHLECFFGVSVLKDVDPWTVPVAAEQLSMLKDMAARGARIPLLDPAPAIEPGRKLRAPGVATRPEGFRTYLKGRPA